MKKPDDTCGYKNCTGILRRRRSIGYDLGMTPSLILCCNRCQRVLISDSAGDPEVQVSPSDLGTHETIPELIQRTREGNGGPGSIMM